MWCKAYFVTLKRLSVTHECDRQRDERTDSLMANAALNYVVQPTRSVWPSLLGLYFIMENANIAGLPAELQYHGLLIILMSYVKD